MKLLAVHTSHLGRTMAEAIEEETMETMKEDYSGGYGGRNNGDYEGRL